MTAGVDQSGYSLKFSNRARMISIRVSPGSVSVTAPPGADPGLIDIFVGSRSKWIEEKLALFNSCKGPSSLVQFEDGAALWLLGREVCLQVEKNRAYPLLKNSKLLLGEEWISRSRFSRWLDKQLLTTVTAILNLYSEKTGLNPTRIRIGNARTRWGSCSAKGVIMINRKLVHAPVDVIEYVFVHELVHLRHRNHSRLFWNTVEHYLGDVKPQKRWLKLQGAYLL